MSNCEPSEPRKTHLMLLELAASTPTHAMCGNRVSTRSWKGAKRSGTVPSATCCPCSIKLCRYEVALLVVEADKEVLTRACASSALEDVRLSPPSHPKPPGA